MRADVHALDIGDRVGGRVRTLAGEAGWIRVRRSSENAVCARMNRVDGVIDRVGCRHT